MKIIGIDPGPEYSAVAALEAIPNGPVRLTPITKNTVHDHRWRNQQVIDFLRIIDPWAHPVAIETFDYTGKPFGKSGFETLMWIGRFCQVIEDQKKYKLHLLRAGSEIKYNICNDSHAKKKFVWQALRDRLGEPATAKAPGPTYGFHSHCWDALAAAYVCWLLFYGGKP
jgi:hypothetical protein